MFPCYREGTHAALKLQEFLEDFKCSYYLGVEISPQNIIKAPKGNYEQN